MRDERPPRGRPATDLALLWAAITVLAVSSAATLHPTIARDHGALEFALTRAP